MRRLLGDRADYAGPQSSRRYPTPRAVRLVVNPERYRGESSTKVGLYRG